MLEICKVVSLQRQQYLNREACEPLMGMKELLRPSSLTCSARSLLPIPRTTAVALLRMALL